MNAIFVPAEEELVVPDNASIELNGTAHPVHKSVESMKETIERLQNPDSCWWTLVWGCW